MVGELGRTVVLATHSMPEAEALCDRLAFIQDGRIVAQGSVEELRRAIGYGTRCELRLRGSSPEAAGRLALIPGVTALTAESVAAGASDGATSLIRLTLVSSDALPALLRSLVGAGIDVVGCVTSERSLEEIYIETLGPAATRPPAAVAVPAR